MSTDDETRSELAEAQRRARASVNHPGEHLADGTLVAGRYRIVRSIARGGMGAVYEADDLELRTKVALKTILGIADEKAKERFRREIYLARQVTHPT